MDTFFYLFAERKFHVQLPIKITSDAKRALSVFIMCVTAFPAAVILVKHAMIEPNYFILVQGLSSF